ncbi:hypothetical protein [Bifidobacterium psychraerophilum]|uniref:hypothetical protein n=1 Tax=Bifidobacterium psychraerophilum TaxID=218140 RepID=UPI0039EC230E
MHITAHIPGSAAVTLDEYAEGKRLIFAHPLQMVKSLFITLVQPLDINWDGYNLGRNIQPFTGNGPVLPASVTVPILFASTILILKGCATNLHIDWSGRLIAIAILILFFAATGAGIMASWHPGDHGVWGDTSTAYKADTISRSIRFSSCSFLA